MGMPQALCLGDILHVVSDMLLYRLQHSASLTNKCASQVEWQLDILLEDCGAFDEALALLDTLPRETRAAALKRQVSIMII